MTASAGFRSRILVGDLNLSAYAQSVGSPLSVDMLDITTFADNGVKAFIPGQNTSTWNFDGILDVDGTANAQFDNLGDFTDEQPLTYGPRGFTIGREVQMASAWRVDYPTLSSVTEPVKFSLAAQTNGPTEFGVSLHDLGAETADVNSASVDNGAQTTTGAVAHLHVTAYSGLTSAVITVQDSADNSSFATIGTFTTVTAITQQRLAIAGTVRRYTRAALDVTGTGSVTYAVALARR